MNNVHTTTMDSPIGRLLLVGSETQAGLALDSVSVTDEVHNGQSDPEFETIVRQLESYFSGSRQAFDVAHTDRGTPFQQRVWAAVEAIPYGTTVTYGQLAASVGASRDRIRAVAAAVGANPLLVVRPCHRVIGADGTLTGYAAGLPRKEFLLTHEGAMLP
jgi:methylated-DNA-[protein]-cysteine S-methyltransferase